MGQVGFTDCHRPAHRVWNLCRHGESSVTLRLLPLSADRHIAHIGWSPSAIVVVDLELLESVDCSGLSMLESSDCSGMSMLESSDCSGLSMLESSDHSVVVVSDSDWYGCIAIPCWAVSIDLLRLEKWNRQSGMSISKWNPIAWYLHGTRLALL